MWHTEGAQVIFHLEQLLLVLHIGLVLVDHGNLLALGHLLSLAPLELDHTLRAATGCSDRTTQPAASTPGFHGVRIGHGELIRVTNAHQAEQIR